MEKRNGFWLSTKMKECVCEGGKAIWDGMGRKKDIVGVKRTWHKMMGIEKSSFILVVCTYKYIQIISLFIHLNSDYDFWLFLLF